MSFMEVELKQNPNNGMHDVQYLLDNGVVGQTEVVKVIKERKLFLHKAEMKDISREDYLAQIRAEIQLLDICKHNIDNRSQVDEMQLVYVKVFDMLINRIDFLYFSMLQMFPIILTSLQQFMEFRFNHKKYINDTTLLRKLMSNNHNDPEVYKLAALFEYSKMCDVEAARLYFSEGLKYHKHCKILYIEEFNLEVQHVEHTNGQSLPIALSKYKNMVEYFKGDLEFHITLIDKALQFNTVWELQYHVVRDMFEEYKHDERMWLKLANISFQGFIFDHDLELMNFDRHCKRRLLYSLKAFDDGLKEDWTPIKRTLLWDLLIDHVIGIWKEYGWKNETIVSFVNETMERVFQGAQDEGFLHKGEHYAYWAVYKIEKSDEISSKAIEMNKNNPKVWMELLSIFIETDCPLRAFKVFQYGIKSLESDAMPLCQMMETFLITQNETMLLDFYDQATYGSSTNISLIFRVKYLKWFKIRNTLTAVRKLFKELIIMSPPCKHLYIEMISYEQSLTSVNVDRVSKLYNNVCCNLGQGDVELWTNYIRFVYKHVQRCTAKKIYKSSLPFLGPELFGDLTKEYENIKKEIA